MPAECLRHPPQEAGGPADERGDLARQRTALQYLRLRRACFRPSEGEDGAVRRGIGRAKMKIGVVNLAYNFSRQV